MTGKTRVLLFAARAAVLILTGCATPETYPKEITGIGDSAEYPLKVADFERQGIYQLSPQKPDASIIHLLCQSEGRFLDARLELRILQSGDSGEELSTELETEKAKFLQPDLDMELQIEGTVIFRKRGVSYVAFRASFVGKGYPVCYENVISFPLPRYYEIIVWRHENRVLSLHSSARAEHSNIASAKNLELIDAVNWTVLPF